MLGCQDIVCEIAKYLCLQYQNCLLAPLCEQTAVAVLSAQSFIIDAMNPEGQECMFFSQNTSLIHRSSAGSFAASRGHLSCLQFSARNKGRIDESMFVESMHHRHFACAKFIYNQFQFNPIINPTWLAATQGDLDCLKYLREKGCEWDPKTCAIAALHGHLHILQYAHENGCKWNEDTCSLAAQAGNLHCLQYAHKNGCPWDKNTMLLAASFGHIECLIYAHENKCPTDAWTYFSAYTANQTKCALYLQKNNLVK